MKRTTKTDRFTNLLKWYNYTKHWLKIHPNVITVNTDKGQKTVLMEKQSYEQKIINLLDDSNIYQQLQHDPTNSLQNKLNKIITTLETGKNINKQTAYNLKCHNGNMGKIYGEIKIHKPEMLLRPIIGTPLYQLSKYKSKILTNITHKTDNYVKTAVN